MTDTTRQGIEPDHSIEEAIAMVRRQVDSRIEDPFMTAHDRWVLGRFADFLGALALPPRPARDSRTGARPIPNGTCAPSTTRPQSDPQRRSH